MVKFCVSISFAVPCCTLIVASSLNVFAVTTSSEGDIGQGPNVEAALSVSPTTAQLTAELHKPTIGGRKPAAPKKGVGAKR